MNTFLTYILESTICISVFYLLFRVLMRKETSFAVNRATLLTIVLASVIVPLVQLPQLMQTPVHVELIPEFSENKIQIQNLPATENTASFEVQQPVGETASATNELTIPLETLLRYFYMAGVLVAFLLFIRNVIQIFMLSRKATVQQMDGYRLLIVDREVPSFAFGHSVIISQTDYDTHGQAILAHEQAHIRQNHFVDLLLLELVRTIHWFNPAVYALIGDLKEIHEFQADEQTLHSGIDAKQYQLLIIQKGVGPRRFALANSFNHCQIKKRITMMNKSKTSKAWRWKVATFLPLLALLLMAFGNRSETRIKQEIQNGMSSITQSGFEDDIRSTNQDDVSGQKVSNLAVNDQRKEETAIIEVYQEPQKVIKGKVIDEYGNALEGVSVAGSKRMKTTTDANGNFEIAMTEDVPLWFSHAGLQRTARTPIELEETTLVKMELDPYYLGGPVSVAMKTSTTNRQTKGKLQEDKHPMQAAEKMVKGKVVDSNDKPLERASVVVAGKTIGTLTDKDGVFNLNLSDTSSIVVSYVGFKSVKLAPDFEQLMNIRLQPENIEIDNVVVVGYTTRTNNKEKLTIKGANSEGNSDAGNKKVFTIVEQMPEFPGGALALRKYIAQQIKYPVVAQEHGIQGDVYVSFVINSYGVVSNVKIARSVDPALDNEAIRVIYTMPKWKPGFQQGKAVDVAYSLPITFILSYSPPMPLAK